MMKAVGYMALGAWILILLALNVFYVVLGTLGDAPARTATLVMTVITTVLTVVIFNRKGEAHDN